jgi:hypothetical protein
MPKRITTVQLLLVIATIALALIWLLPPVAKARPPKSQADFLWELTILLPMVLPPLLAKACPQLCKGSYPEPDKRLFALKRDWCQFQADVKAAGVLSWLWFAAVIAGIVVFSYKDRYLG